MKVGLNEKKELRVIIEIPVILAEREFDYEITERIFSILLRSGRTETMKDIVKSKLITEAVKVYQDSIHRQITRKVDEAWEAVEILFPEPLPEETIKEKAPRAKRVRCSRQLTAAELAQERDKLLAELEGLI